MDSASIINIIDTINAMKRQEQSGYNTQNGLYNRTTRRKNITSIDTECRRSMVSWCKQVAKFCNLNHHTIAIAVNTLDRFVAKDPQILSNNNNRCEFQLAAMASLYTSVKINEPAAIDPVTMSQLSRGAFAPRDIEKMEKRILSKLGWRVNAPTAMAFAELYLQLLIPSDQAIIAKKTIQSQLEHVMEDYRFLGFSASEIASSATRNTLTVMFGYPPYLANFKNLLDLNTIPFPLEKMLMDYIPYTKSGVISLYKDGVPATKEQQPNHLSPITKRHHLSPRSIALA